MKKFLTFAVLGLRSGNLKKLSTVAFLGLLLAGAIGTGAAVAATGEPSAVVDTLASVHSMHLVHTIGFYQYHPTCSIGIVGYDIWGNPIYGPVCG